MDKILLMAGYDRLQEITAAVSSSVAEYQKSDKDHEKGQAGSNAFLTLLIYYVTDFSIRFTAEMIQIFILLPNLPKQP